MQQLEQTYKRPIIPTDTYFNLFHKRIYYLKIIFY